MWQTGLMSNISSKYLWRTSNYGFLYGAGNNKGVLGAFSDADFAGDVKTRRSRGGVVAVYAGSAIVWSSQLQWSVALSTPEAAFITASEGAKGLLWLKHLLRELGGNSSVVSTLHVDNASAGKLTKSSESHNQSKHAEVRYYFVHVLPGWLHRGEIHQQSNTVSRFVDKTSGSNAVWDPT